MTTNSMNPLDDDLLPIMAGDYHVPGNDLEVDEDDHLEAYDLYSSTGASLPSLKNKFPRQVNRGPPPGAQRINRGIKKSKRVEKHNFRVPGPITEQWQEDDSAVKKDCSQELKRFKKDFPSVSTAHLSPFLSEPSGHMGQNFTHQFSDFPISPPDFPLPPPDPEDNFLGPLVDSSSASSLAYATHANQKTSVDKDPFSLSLETAQALIGKGNPSLPHCGPLRYSVHEGRLGIGKEDTRRPIPEIDRLPDNLEPDSSESEKEDDEKNDVEKDDGVLLVPKIEPGPGDEELPEMQNGLLGSIPEASEEGHGLQTPFKRPRGRPRKHPLPVHGENLNKMGKGRSKTGCITCRKRKKKCDEAKPKCLNCEKNAVLCEGYQPLAPWKSGKEKAASESMERGRSNSYFPQSPASAYATYTFGTPEYSLPSLINGIETNSDRIFFAHYCTRLSGKLTVEGPECSAFRQQMLPMAVQHEGLLHSILALSAANIDWSSDYGQSVLDKHPDLSVREIENRGHHHHNLAMEQINRDMDQQRELEARGEAPDPAVIKVRYGQMLCLVIKALAEGNTEGAHRMHLKAYENLAALYPSDDSPFMKFVHEYFKYHVCFDQLVAPPNTYPVLDNEEFWLSPKIQMTIGPTPLSLTQASFKDNVPSEHAGGIFGLQQGIYNAFMRRIGKIRQDIRERMEQGLEPHVDYAALYHASQLEGQIRNWADASPPPDPQDDTKLSEQKRWHSDHAYYNIGMLYKNMLWVYLYRTIYPPNTEDYPKPIESDGSYLPAPTTMRYNERIRHAVDQAIGYMQRFKGEDPCQTMLLSPAFMIGCAAFEEGQRAAIRRIVRRVKSYTTLKNADPAMQVLEEVWKRMDGRGDQKWKGEEGILRNSRGMRDGGRESSWDWEKIAGNLRVDFLAT